VLELARSLCELGAALRRSKRRADSRPVLREAIELAHRCLADPLEERAQTELQTERDELLRTAAVVVVPSRIMPNGRTEGTPAIALEALAAGVPVIASSVCGLRDLPGVRPVPPEDPGELGRAIDQLLANPPSAESLRAAVANFDWREVAPRLIRE